MCDSHGWTLHLHWPWATVACFLLFERAVGAQVGTMALRQQVSVSKRLCCRQGSKDALLCLWLGSYHFSFYSDKVIEILAQKPKRWKTIIFSNSVFFGHVNLQHTASDWCVKYCIHCHIFLVWQDMQQKDAIAVFFSHSTIAVTNQTGTRQNLLAAWYCKLKTLGETVIAITCRRLLFQMMKLQILSYLYWSFVSERNCFLSPTL